MYREGVQPNFASDSVVQLYAFCIAMAEIAMAEVGSG